MILTVKGSEPESIELHLKDGVDNSIILKDGDTYLGYFKWTPWDGLIFQSSKIKGYTLPLYGEDADNTEGYKAED